MAVTKIHAIKHTVKKALDYIMNPEKTFIGDKQLVEGFLVAPETAYIEFQMTANLAVELNGNYKKTGGANNLAYHMMQSFDPKDDVTPEEAIEIGKAWASKILGDKHEYVIATHVDREHIHNHIIFNATSTEFTKFKSVPYKTIAQLRDESDRLCIEHSLSVIKERGWGKNRIEWQMEKEGKTTWKQAIRNKIDELLNEKKITDYNKFKEEMQSAGFEVVDTGKYIKYKAPVQERYARGNKLGYQYEQKEIEARISKNNVKLQELPGEPQKTNEIIITINGKMVKNELSNGYVTKVPRENYSVYFDNKEAYWKNDKTLEVCVNKNKMYTVLDTAGKPFGMVSWGDLDNYYNSKETEKQKCMRIAGEIKSGARPLTLAGSLAILKSKSYATKSNKERQLELKAYANALMVLRKEGVEYGGSLQKRHMQLQNLQQELVGGGIILRLEGDELIATAKLLQSYEKYLPLKQAYNKTIFKKKFYEKNKNDLDTFYFTLKQMEEKGIIERAAAPVIEKIKEIRKEVEKTDEECKIIDTRLEKFEQAMRIIVNPQEGVGELRSSTKELQLDDNATLDERLVAAKEIAAAHNRQVEHNQYRSEKSREKNNGEER
ncbi:hypothetical protein AGMMS50284_1370 [Clostridia bacterium]|nr:hypothetical protein AGMMS50284_1370 [Clostridia bacterium]